MLGAWRFALRFPVLAAVRLGHSCFGLQSSFVLRHSDLSSRRPWWFNIGFGGAMPAGLPVRCHKGALRVQKPGTAGASETRPKPSGPTERSATWELSSETHRLAERGQQPVEHPLAGYPFPHNHQQDERHQRQPNGQGRPRAQRDLEPPMEQPVLAVMVVHV